MKKIFLILLTVLMVSSLSTVGFASGEGSITIDNAMEDGTYEIYKLLDFTSTGDFTGIYTIAPGWEAFFTSDVAKSYCDLIVNGDQTTVVFDANATIDQTFAKAAVAYADANGIDATATRSATNKTVEFTGLDYGYYAIDTSVGALCALTDTNSDFVTVEKKSITPEIECMVKDDSTDTWNNENNLVVIGQKVEYSTTVNIGSDIRNYIIHCKLDIGLTFNDDVAVEFDGNIVDASEYTVIVDPEDGDSFDILFDNGFIYDIGMGSEISVYYSATLNENAVNAYDGSRNTAKLTYGEDSMWSTDDHEITTFAISTSDDPNFTIDSDETTETSVPDTTENGTQDLTEKEDADENENDSSNMLSTAFIIVVTLLVVVIVVLLG